MRDDTFTNSEEFAGSYERIRGDQDYASDRPTRRELAEDRQADREREKDQRIADEANLAAGRYVAPPEVKLRASILAIRLGQRNLYGIEVVPVMEHIFRIDGMANPTHEAWADLPDEYEVKVVEGVVWVRWIDPVPSTPPF